MHWATIVPELTTSLCVSGLGFPLSLGEPAMGFGRILSPPLTFITVTFATFIAQSGNRTFEKNYQEMNQSNPTPEGFAFLDFSS